MSWERRFVEVYQEVLESEQDSFYSSDLSDLTGHESSVIGRDISRLKEEYGEELPVEIERNSPNESSRYHFEDDLSVEDLRSLLDSERPSNRRDRLYLEVIDQLESREYDRQELNSIISSLAQEYFNGKYHRAKVSSDIKDRLKQEKILTGKGDKFKVRDL